MVAIQSQYQQGSQQQNLTMSALSQQQQAQSSCSDQCAQILSQFGNKYTIPLVDPAGWLFCLQQCVSNGGVAQQPPLNRLGASIQQSVLDPFFASAKSWGLHIALFLGALILVIVGMFVLTKNQGG